MNCRERLESYLGESNVAFEVREHPTAFTAQEVAAAEHVKGRRFAKVVIVVADGEMWMAVLPASENVSFSRLRAALGVTSARLAHEEEFASRFPDCDTGAMPPFGHLYGLHVVLDETLSRNERIVFQAGTHTTTMSVPYSDFARIERPLVADLGIVPVAA